MRPVIKKCVLLLAFVFAAAFLFAQDQDQSYYADNAGTEELDLYYFNLPIVKIFNHPRGYYILYRTPSLKIGKLYVPWEWMDYTDHRAIYNTVRVGVSPYVSYVTNSGEFFQIRINASVDPRDSTWGVISSGRVPDEYFDVDTLTLQF